MSVRSVGSEEVGVGVHSHFVRGVVVEWREGSLERAEGRGRGRSVKRGRLYGTQDCLYILQKQISQVSQCSE
jgi:hypothetical protein